MLFVGSKGCLILAFAFSRHADQPLPCTMQYCRICERSVPVLIGLVKSHRTLVVIMSPRLRLCSLCCRLTSSPLPEELNAIWLLLSCCSTLNYDLMLWRKSESRVVLSCNSSGALRLTSPVNAVFSDSSPLLLLLLSVDRTPTPLNEE